MSGSCLAKVCRPGPPTGGRCRAGRSAGRFGAIWWRAGAAWAILLVAACSGRGHVGPFVFPTAAAQQILDQLVASSDAPGAILAVSVKGGPTTILTSGVSDPRARTPMKPDDVFPIASNTKTFVAALVLTLVRDGSVRLDAAINSYGVDFPNGDRITVRELLNHTSGIPALGGDGNGLEQYAQAFQDKINADLRHRYTPAEIMAYVRDRPLLFPPGTIASYSNINAILAGQIVEKVTGESLTAALHRRLFGPLKLTSSYYAAEETPPRAVVPGLFTLQTGGPVLNTADIDHTAFLTAIGAAGAMVSDAADLVTWGNALLRAGTVLGPALTKEAHRIGPGGTGLGVIGFSPHGPCVFAYSGCPPNTHFPGYGGSGAVPGAKSLIVYDTRSDSVITLFANRLPVDQLNQAATDELTLIAKTDR
jgi:CubicO group peptidase (beta-lactamase class C family)